MSEAIFPMGQIVATSGALSKENDGEILLFLSRHGRGDWGCLCAEDHSANDSALVHGGRIFSAFEREDGEKFWIITEADRSVTTILLPSEY